MDRRTVIAVVLSLAIWYAWIAFRQATAPEVIAEVEAEAPIPTPAPAEPAPGGGPAPVPVVPSAEIRDLPFEGCGAVGTVSTDGGRLRGVTLPDHQAPYHVMPLYEYLLGRIRGTVSGPWRPYGEEPGVAEALSQRAAALVVGAGSGPGTADPGVPIMAVDRDEPSAIELSGTTPAGIAISKRMTESRTGEACTVDLQVTWRNQGTTAFTGDLWLGVHDHTTASDSRYASQRQPMALVDGSLTYGGVLGSGCVQKGTQLTDESGPIPLPGEVSWFGLSDRYFGLFVLPEPTGAGETPPGLQLTRIGSGEDALDGGVLAYPGGLQPGAERSEHYRVYIGPNHTDALEVVDESLSRAVDLGWFAFFGYPLLWLLRQFYALVGNWGIAIILLTFLVKTVFFPMTQRSFKSMQRMQQIQPELAAIKEEYADNPQEMNRRTLEVMQKHQVNPLSGCLPTIVQMPVWIALYNVLLTSVELYHTEFLYLKDLSSPDPYLVLPVTITALMWLQQRMSTPTNLDPVQQQVMRFMPLVFGLMFFAFPSGLAVYVFVNMTLSILQQWFIKRSLSGQSPDGSGGLPAVATS